MTWQERNDRVEEAVRGSETRGQWIRVNCMFCPELLGKTDRARALSVNSLGGWWNCWRCGSRGRLRSLAEYEPNEAPKASKPVEAPEGYQPLWDRDGLSARCLAPARAYLASRGVTPQLIRETRIGAILEGKLAGRVVVPVLKPDGTWAGYVTRAWGKALRPYLNASGMDRKTLFNHAALYRETSVPLMVVEGCFDALHLWPDAVAVLGKPTAEQVEALIACPRPVSVVLDGDAWKEAWALAGHLADARPGKRTGYLRLPATKDPDEYPAEKIRSSVLAALDNPYVWQSPAFEEV